MSITTRIIMPYRSIAADADVSAARRGRRRRGRRYTGAKLGSANTGRGTPWHTGAGDIDLIDFHSTRYGYELHDVFGQFESPQ